LFLLFHLYFGSSFKKLEINFFLSFKPTKFHGQKITNVQKFLSVFLTEWTKKTFNERKKGQNGFAALHPEPPALRHEVQACFAGGNEVLRPAAQSASGRTLCSGLPALLAEEDRLLC
jgi:hypothetical protein